MVDIGRGMAAGFVATMVFSLLVLAAVALGLMPQLAAVAMFGRVLWAQGAPAVAWIAHFLIGTVLWGGLFAAFSPRLPGRTHTARGMAFGLVTWLLAMIVLMPLAGAGPFGLSLGPLAPPTTLALHLAFGAVLGATYSWLLERRAQERRGTPGG